MVETLMTNVFSTADSPQKSCCTEGDKLIYRDNTRYEPDKMPMEGIGMYEGYTHMANLFLSKICSRDGESCSQESGTVKKTADSTINLELQEKNLADP